MDLKELAVFHGNRHPWELARAQFLQKLIKEATHSDGISILDFGSGDGYFAQKLSQEIKGKKLTLIDSNYKQETLTQEIIKLKGLPAVEEKFDLILALDVLEHIKDEEKVLKALKDRLEDNGVLVITVPAWQHLFSNHDKFLGHFRRYNLKAILRVANEAQLQAIDKTYFFSSLYFVRLFQKTFQLIKEDDSETSSWRYSSNHIITKFLLFILKIDSTTSLFMSRLNIYIPGLSVCLICKKK